MLHVLLSTHFYRPEVTGLIHDYSEDFIPSEALWKMKSGKKWPRSEYVSGDADFKVIAAILAGMDFRYQADLVELLRSDEPDLDKICSMFAESRDDIPDWDELLSNFMLHDNEILDYWNRKRDTAANSGTWMHAMLENLLNGYQVHAGVMQGELETAIGVLVSMNDVEVYRTERCIYAPEEDVAGSIDLVLKSRTGNDFFIVDWKRSEKLKEKYHGYGKFMRSPLDEVPDCQGEHYRLQLNIYSWILQKYYDIKVQAMHVVCVHPAYLPDGWVDIAPDMKQVVEKLMESRRKSLSRAIGAAQEVEQHLPPTQPFDVKLSATPRVDETLEDDVQAVLNDLVENLTDEVPAAAKKRRLLPGAATHAEMFQKHFKESADCISSVLDGYVADVRNNSNEILRRTRSALSELQAEFPVVSENIRRLMMVAGYMVEGFIPEKPMLAETATVTWMLEGERHMRVHKGLLYIYDDDGSFLAFGGIPPEAVLHRVGAFFVCLEGIFKRMQQSVGRNAMSVARAIATDMQSFVSEAAFLDACRAAVKRKPPVEHRLDAADEEGHVDNNSGESWTMDMADRAWKVSFTVRYELMQTRMISLIVEWCETEDQRMPSICYDDVCFMYDPSDSSHPIEYVRKGPRNNCYVRIPHPLLDPVMESNTKRLQLFYEQTFWCNLDVFQCCQAALALAKRGLNVDRCFIGISPGGVGQSLYSLHLSEMYKHNHAFFDPNIWHLDEELRKQVETFARCFIITGQEAPESSKKLHTDLYQKDDVCGWHHGQKAIRLHHPHVSCGGVETPRAQPNDVLHGCDGLQLQLDV